MNTSATNPNDNDDDDDDEESSIDLMMISALRNLLLEQNWDGAMEYIQAHLNEVHHYVETSGDTELLYLDDGVPLAFDIAKMIFNKDSIFDLPYSIDYIEEYWDNFVDYESMPFSRIFSLLNRGLVVEHEHDDARPLINKIFQYTLDRLFRVGRGDDETERRDNLICFLVHGILERYGVARALTFINAFPWVLDSPQLFELGMLRAAQQIEEGGRIEDTLLYQVLRTGIENKLSNFDTSTCNLDDPDYRKLVMTSLLSYTEIFQNCMNYKGFFDTFARVIINEFPDICRYKDALSYNDGFLPLQALMNANIEFFEFLIRQCPQIVQIEEGGFAARMFNIALYKKDARSLSALLGIDAPEEDHHLYSNKLNYTFKKSLLHIIYTHGDDGYTKDNTIECARICNRKFPGFSRYILDAWVVIIIMQNDKQSLSGTCWICSFDVMERIVQELNMDLSFSDEGGVTSLHRALLCQGEACQAGASTRTVDNGDGWIPEVRNILSLLLNDRYNTENVATIRTSGRLPLHFACVLGLPWGLGVDMVYEAFPAAISIFDELTGLKPFALAAAASQSNVYSSANLSTIYKLLRACPVVIEECLNGELR